MIWADFPIWNHISIHKIVVSGISNKVSDKKCLGFAQDKTAVAEQCHLSLTNQLEVVLKLVIATK